MRKKRVLLAFSGGLDTSVCVRWLTERGWEVVAFCADVGQGADLKPVRERALRCGAARVIVRDLKLPFARDFVLPALRAGAVYEGKYLLATALSRPLIAQALAEAARATGASAVAHGCTGKGNDQVRLEVSLRVLAPSLKILAPVRMWELKSRREEVAYARNRKLDIPPTKESLYSIDQNLWGVSIESGPLEDPWTEPPESAYRWTADPAKAPAKGTVVRIEFRRGIPVALNGRFRPLPDLIAELNRTAGRHGVGRSDLIEDRLVGIKSREIYEAPAATVLHEALTALEELTLDRETQEMKRHLAQRYARLVYDGLWFTPLKKALDAFTEAAEGRVTGTVRVRLVRGRATAVGRRSPHSRYRQTLATYSGKGRFNQAAAEGFIKLWGLPHEGEKP